MPKSHRPSASSTPTDSFGRTELHDAAIEGDGPRCRQLLAENTNPNVVDTLGWTPLHYAAQRQAIEVVDALLAAGATVDALDKHGNSPLGNAVFSSHGNGLVIERLRAAGADPYLANLHGVSPIRLARTIANFDVAQFFEDLPVEA